MITLTGIEKAFDNIQHPFMIKKNPPSTIEIEGVFPNLTRGPYKNKQPTGNTTRNSRKTRFPLTSGTGQGYILTLHSTLH